MIRIKAVNYEGASGVYDSEGAARVRCFVTNDEGAFDVWATSNAGLWIAEWPASLAGDRAYTVRAELWTRAAHTQAMLGP